jgi:hypothetical protein
MPGVRHSDAPIRIAQVSDFHFRTWNDRLEQAQRLLRSLDYDLLVATGDFCRSPQTWEHAANLCRRFFEPLRPPLGIFAVLGNHDDSRLALQPHLPFRVLRDEHVTLHTRGTPLIIAGIDQCNGRSGDVAKALRGISSPTPTVLLAHYPSTVYQVPKDRVQLVLSGHTHGGQIRLPGLGCIWSNDRIPCRYAWGLNDVNGTLLHVTAGIGVSGPIRCRFRCPPEISVISLVCADNRTMTRSDTSAGVQRDSRVGAMAAKV